MYAIDDLLDRISMYRLAQRGLLFLAAIALVASFFQLLPFTLAQLGISLVLLLATTHVSNRFFALLAKAPVTPESAQISGLLLFFILTPLQSAHDGLLLIVLGALAMASKYLLVIHRRHIFNPVAVAALLAGVWSAPLVSWWIMSPVLFPFVLVLGILLVRKMRGAALFFSFCITAGVLYGIHALLTGGAIGSALLQFVFTTPVIFVGMILLMEPHTMPPTNSRRLLYGGIVGVFFSPIGSIGPIALSPQLAVLLGNLYAYLVSFRERVVLMLREKRALTRDIYEFAFETESPLRFVAGQYAEWMLPHAKPDKRGVRRYFAFSSAPEDPLVRISMRVPVEGSTLKKHIGTLPKGARVTLSHVAGEFVLPKDPNRKFAVLAGDIGVAPFISICRHLYAQRERRDMVLIYAATSPLDFAFQKELERLAPAIGLRIVYLPADFTELSSWSGKSGLLTGSLIHEEVPDFATRTWYLSGSYELITTGIQLLRKLGVKRRAIRTEYFPGL